MLVAISGVPGTGKRSACTVLTKMGYAVHDLEEIARREGCVVGRDDVRETDLVDVDLLRTKLQVPTRLAFLRGHYSHLMPVDIAIVLRCRPSILRGRLERRGWPPAKVQENVEAEAIGAIPQEAVARLARVFAVDTSASTPEATAHAILGILQGKTDGHGPGEIDWSDEVLSWY